MCTYVPTRAPHTNFHFQLEQRTMSASLLDPASKEPLFPLVLREIGDATADGGGGEADVGPFIGGRETPDPSPAHSPVDSPRLTEFWAAAHALSCLRRGALSSSVVVTYNDAMATSLDGQVRGILFASNNNIAERCMRKY